MLFQSSIRKELARSFGATLVVLITIVMTIVLIRTLGQASRGFISPQDVMLIMAYAALGRLPTILTLSLFIAMVSTLSRMYRDSEMVVWFSSGRGLAGFLGPLFRFAWPVLLVITLMSLFVWPWSNQQTLEMKTRYEKRGDLERIAPGQFQESASGNRVFFIDRETAGPKASNNVFIASTEKGKSAITTARSGRIETQGDAQMLMLEAGQRLEAVIGKSALKISDFEEYGSKAGSATELNGDAQEPKSKSTRTLLKSPTRSHLSELAWRIGLALAAVNFVVLAVALASVNPRAGRSSNLIFVLFAFVVYNNLLNLGQNWISQGLIGFGNLLLVLHGGALLLGLLWLAKRHSNWTLKAALRPRRATPAQTGARP
ncbi:LPS export ABC transporter permease LptF [Polaromonas sp.]|uniref:LPS export ABC transporter permease LptF n=1 Tax=Polaromonas sp. TaxID=1869339 RepID=UPI002FC8E9AE